MNKKNSTIVITGASGLLGNALKNQLALQGYSNVIGICSKDADLTDYAQTLAIFEKIKPDYVCHLAARVYGIMGNILNMGLVFLDNIRINSNVIEASRVVGVKKIIAMGTTAVYSDEVTLPISENEIWNGAPHYSEAAYGHAKRAVLGQLEAYHTQYGMNYAYCISTNLFGPHDKFDENQGHVIPSLISKFQRAIKDNTALTVWGSGIAKRDFLFSEDAARAIVLILEQFNGVINLASGKSTSIKDTVELLKNILNFKGNIVWDVDKPNGQERREYDVTRLSALGFKPSYSLHEALEYTFNWYKDNYAIARR